MKTHALYERVTNQIINEIEAGNLPPWLKPWKDGKRTGIVPVNAATERPYSGINVLVLWAEREAKGYGTARWLTFKQCQEIGGHVRKGEKATSVIFVKRYEVEDEERGGQRQAPITIRTFNVFNEAQCDGLPVHEPEPELPEPERHEKAEAFLTATGATVRWDDDMAAYVPSQDLIVMPPRSAFLSSESLYATWSHECVHWTGAESRLNRDLSPRYNTDSYAFEELIAEIGAAMVCAYLGVKGELRHASYVEHWLRVLKKDSRAILTAASHASKAADFLRKFTDPSE